ncbi:hypothetical protein [Halobacillus litoralis]|uniref:hypothetical protein n=1 Tax=Halobacillus litoralis TaxID=45668 RepID=UPI001F253C14|nr:hypothetical protein [Halobacillus litoralis]
MKNILFIAIALFITAGCTSSQSAGENAEEKDTTEEEVTKVLEQVFSGPEEELAQLYEENDFEGISNYYMNQFEPYFTEEYMTDAINTNLLSSFHQKAFGNDVTMEIGNQSVEQSEETETAYDFEMQILISNGQKADVSGRVNTNEDGKITRIHYNDIQTLLHAFDTSVETEEGRFEYDRSRLVSRTEDQA